MRRITTLLVDDNLLLRASLSRVFAAFDEVELVGEAGDGTEAVAKVRELQPDVVLMDIRMPHCDGIEATRLIAAEFHRVRVVMLTVSEEETDLFEAIKSGACGYLLKDLRPEYLVERIVAVHNGESPVSPCMADRILSEFIRQSHCQATSRARQVELTERETEVLKLVSLGATNKEIAAQLCIALGTVKNHLHNILEKLHLRNRSQIAAYARIEHYVGPEGNTHPLM
jgi:two-component system NarL family response regulator